MLIKGKWRGVWAKTPFFFPLLAAEQGKGRAAPAAADSAALGLDGGPG